jgi:hypothetical protein
MANMKLGYIGKSFAFGALGIIATLVACGGGGTTNVVAQQTATVSPYVLFASSFLGKSNASSDPWMVSGEGGDVYTFASNGFQRNWGLDNDNDRAERQAVGQQFAHAAAVTSADYFGYSFKAPENGTVNASQSGTLVISMGNGALTGNANSHTTFVIDVQGGTQNPTTYNWTNACSVDKALVATGNSYGLRTYRIPLSSLTCSSGTLAALKTDIKQVSVKVVGGKEATKDASTAANSTLMQVSYIAFAK